MTQQKESDTRKFGVEYALPLMKSINVISKEMLQLNMDLNCRFSLEFQQLYCDTPKHFSVFLF